MDASLLQSMGALMGGAGTLIGGAMVAANKTKIGTYFKRREQLVAERNVAMAQGSDAMRRAMAAEALALDLERSVVTLRGNMQDRDITFKLVQEQLATVQNQLDERIRSVEVVKEKFDALMDWTQKILDYVVWLETEAKRSGVDTTQRYMPTVPKVLADKFGVPESLQ